MNVDLRVMVDGVELPASDLTSGVMQVVQGAAFTWHAEGGCSGFPSDHYHMTLMLGPIPTMCPTCYATVLDQEKHDAVMHPPPEPAPNPE